jgi:hypothetical protein
MPGVGILEPFLDERLCVLQHANQLLRRQADHDLIGLLVDNLKQWPIEVVRMGDLVPVPPRRRIRQWRGGPERRNFMLILVRPVPSVVLDPVRCRQGCHLQAGRDAPDYRQPTRFGLYRRRGCRLACSHDGDGTSNCQVHTYTRNRKFILP